MRVLTLHVLQHHAEVPARLEGAEHGHHEGVLCEGEDVPLHEGLLDLVPQDEVLLVDLLHGEALARLAVPHQVDGPVGGRRGSEEGRRVNGRGWRRVKRFGDAPEKFDALG